MKYPFVIVILSLFASVNLKAQASINPSDAVPICGHGYYDIGLPKTNFTDIADFNCFPQDAIFDHYEVILIQGITKGGTININFMPAGEEDVDFIAYKLDGRNLTPLRCMASGKTFGNETATCLGMTGLSEGSEDLVEFEGCDGGNDNFVKNLDAEIGDKFIILITNYKSGNSVPMEMYGTAEFDMPNIILEDSLQFCKDFNFTIKLPANNKFAYNWEVSQNPVDQFSPLNSSFGNRFVLPTNQIGEKYYRVKVSLIGSSCKESTSNVSLVKTIDCPQCNDGIKNGSETDIDCGGKDCPSCTGCELITNLVLNDTIVNCEGEWTDTVQLLANYCNVVYEGNFSMEIKGDDCLSEIIKTWTFELPDSIAVVRQVITVDKKPVINNINLAANFQVQCDYYIPSPPVLSYINKCSKDTIYPVFSENLRTGDNLPPRLLRKWVFPTPCGDSLVINQSILIFYNQGIKIPAIPGNILLTCEDETPSAPNLSVQVDCNTSIAPKFTEVLSGNACTEIITRTYTFSLPNGQDTSLAYTITKIDTVAPIPELIPTNLKFLCLTDTTDRPIILAKDNCTPGSINPIYSINNNGGLGTEESPLIFKRNWIFKDLCGNSSEVNQEITVQNSAEILLPEVPKDTLVSCLSEIPDTANLIAAAGCGVSINGQFSEQRIGNACDMTIIRTWNFSYLDLNPKTLIQTIKVLNQFKPQYVVPNDSTIACGTDLNPDLLGYPSNIIVGCGIGRDVFYKDVFAEKSDCPGSGLITRSWHIKDQCGNESIQKQFITTVDTSAPQLIEPVENVSIACKVDIPTAPELFAIDLCTGEKIKGLFSQTDNGGDAIPSNHLVISRNWYFIDKCGNDQTTRQTITVTGSTDVTYPEAPSAYTVACLDEVGAMEDLVATNGCENRAEGLKNELRTGDSCQMQIMRTWTFSFPDIPTKTISQTITISNKKTPDFKVPDNLTISCDENKTLEVLGEVGEITTYCNIGTESSFIDGPINEICTGTGSWNRIWKVTDVCGNTAVKTQIISIEDKIAPIPPSPEEDLVFNCRSEITNPLDLIAVDNCFEGEIHGMLTTINNEGLGTITNPFILSRKWTFTDNCGNVSETFQKVTVSDDSEIQLPSPPQNFTIHCLDELGKEETLFASDYCNDSIIGIFNEERIGDLCNMTIIRTWTFSNFDKEVKTIRQEIALINNIEPDFLAPENVELFCGEYESNGIYGEPTMIDVNCNNSFQITYQDEQLNKICGNAGTVIREWKVLDQCANETSKSQTIKIIDVSPPIPQNIPENQILSCLSELELPVIQNAIDECSGELIPASPKFSDNTGIGIASNPLIRTINWSFTDACGNTAIAEQIITVAGTTENIYDVAPPPITVQCVGDIPPPNVLNGRNACGTQAEVIFNQQETGNNCFKIITRTWTFKLPDQIDHVETQIITLENDFKPEFKLPENQLINCEIYDLNTKFGDITNIVTGCNVNYTVSFEDSGEFNAACKNGIKIDRSWTVTDVCGNETTEIQTLTLQDNLAPIAPLAEADLLFNCYDDITLPIELFAADNCTGDLIEGVLSEIDDENFGTITSPRKINRTWTFTDACGNVSTANQLITISDNSEINLPARPDDYTIKCIEDLLGAETLIATDACSDSIMGDLVVNEVGDDCNKVITRTWTFTNLDKSPKTIVQTVTLDNNELPTFIVPDGLSLQCGEYDENTEYGVPRNVEVNCSNTYDITYLDVVTNFGCGGTKTISRRWKVLDNCGNEMEQEQLIEIIDTQAPIPQNIPSHLTFECMSDLTDYENQMAIDDCTGDQIISIPNISQNDGNGNSGNPFIQTRTWIFTDVCGNSIEAVQTASIIGTSENYYEPAPSDVLVSCDSLVEQEVTLVGNNICDVNATVTFNEIESGNDCDKTITRTWDFDLPNQTTHREIQNIRILKNVPPSIQSPDPQTIGCDIYNSAEQYGADPIVDTYCDLSFTLSFSDVGNLNVACLDGVAITRTWIATDACGNTATSEQILTLKDETGPLISSVGPDVIGKCENDVPDVKFSQIIFTDNCRSSFYDFHYEDIKTNLSPYSTCEDHFLLERKYFVIDACGNSSNMIQNILIEDTEYPEFAEFPDDVTVSCDIPQSTGAEILVTDNCPTFSYGGYSVSDRYITNTTCLIEIERFYETADNCGNRLSRVQLITVKDETGPSFSGSLLDHSFKCIGDIPSPTELGIVVEDECDEIVNFTVYETSQSYICDDKLTIKRTYTSTDQCNNTTTVDQYFYIDNDIKPSIISIFPDTYVEFGNPVPELTESDIEAAYGCATQNGFPDPKLGLTFFIDEDSIPGRCVNNYTIERNISVTDACGNNSEVVYQILVDDSEAPLISRSPGDVLAECSDDPSIIYDFNQYTVTDVASISHSYVEHVNYSNCINDFQKTFTTTFSDGCNEVIDAYNVTVYNPFPPTISEMEDLNYDCKDLVPIDNSGEVIAQAYCNTGSVNIYKSGPDNFSYNICENNFSFIRTFIATDNCGLSSTVQQTITVNDDEAPIAATPPPNQTIYGCGDDYLVNGLIPDINGYSDNCGDVTVTKSKFLRGGLGCSSDPMIIENIWEFTDACGNTSSVSQELRFIDNVAPDFNIPGNLTVSCEHNMPAEIIPSVTDNCSIQNTSFDEINLGGIGNAASPKVFERIYSASDGCNVTTKSQLISVIDANPPTITSNLPSDILQECKTLPPVPTVTAFDSESCAQITTTFRELTNGRTGCQGDILVVNRIWTFVDYVGNETVVTQTITINDSEGPELIFNITPEQDVQVNSPDLIPRADIIRANAIDNCNGNLSVTLTQTDNDKIGCASDPRYIYRTWTATDICGNLGIHDQLVTLIDDLPPTFTVPQDQDLDCDLGIPPAVPLNLLNAVDSAGVAGYSYNDQYISGNGSNAQDPLIRHRTYTVTDNCGNQADQVQELRFVDYNPGTISGGDGLYCNGEVVTLTAIGGTIVSWSNGGNGTSTMVAAPNLITADIINNHGCITTPSKNIEAYNNEISISYSGESICDGTVIATPSIEYAQSYRWFIAGNLISTANSLNLVPYAGLSGGYVEATYGNNCVKSINLSLPPNEVCCYPPEFCGNFSPNKDSLIISFICSPGSIRDTPNSNKRGLLASRIEINSYSDPPVVIDTSELLTGQVQSVTVCWKHQPDCCKTIEFKK